MQLRLITLVQYYCDVSRYWLQMKLYAQSTNKSLSHADCTVPNITELTHLLYLTWEHSKYRN